MKSFSFFRAVVAAAYISLPCSAVAQGSEALTTARIDSILRPRIIAGEFSGVARVARNGKVIYERAAGIANRTLRSPMKINTRLQIASMTKLITQIAIQQLAQSGRLLLSDTVGRWLPDYPNATVRSKVTIDELLHHRSGIGSFWNERFLADHARVRTTRDYMDLFDSDSLLFSPGTSETYSNGGYVVLGAIIERITGQSYHAYVRQHIFEPAGMTATGPYDSRMRYANAAVGYTTQSIDGPMAGDRRLAGSGAPPGSAAQPGASTPQRLLIIGPDGKQLSPEEARAAVAERNAGTSPRRPNTAFEAGVSGPAGDDFSTADDLVRLASALTSHRLLDVDHTNAVLGSRFLQGGEFRANGGGPGVNAELSIYPSGVVIVVLSNYDPPAATAIAQSIRNLVAPARPQ